MSNDKKTTENYWNELTRMSAQLPRQEACPHLRRLRCMCVCLWQHFSWSVVVRDSTVSGTVTIAGEFIATSHG